MNLRDQFGHFTKRGEPTSGEDTPEVEPAEADKIPGPREALRAAIEAAGASEAHVVGLRASIERITDELYDAQRRIRESREALKVEEEAHVRALVDGVAVTELPRKAAAIEAEAEATVAACRSALSMCRNELETAERDQYLSERGVLRAAGEVVEAEALDALIADIEKLRDAWDGRRAVLMFLRQRLSNRGRNIDAALALPAGVPTTHPQIDVWRQAWESLLADPEAVLP